MTAAAPLASAPGAAAATDLAPHELRILVAVDRERGFSAAARALGLTQSAVSHSIRGTERKVGAVLFARGRKGATPTAAGAAAAAHARRVLRLLDTLAAEARGAERGTVAGPLRIAAFRSAALHLLPPVLERLADRHPGIAPEVYVVRELGAGTAGEVAEGRADVGIATIGDLSSRPAGLIGDVLVEEPYALVHPRGHPAPRSLPLVDWHENCGSHTRRWWVRQDWIPKATVLAEDDGAVLSMVSRGLGMAIMPALSLTEVPDGVTVTDLGPGRPTRSVGYLTTAESAAGGSVRALIRELRAAAGAGSVPRPPRHPVHAD